MAGNDIRIISVLYGFTKHTDNLSFIGILSEPKLAHLFQHKGNIAGVAYKCIVGPVVHILERTVPGEKDDVEDG